MTREELLKNKISETNKTQKAIAAEIDIPYSTLRDMLNNVGSARIDNVIKLCQYLGISVSSLNLDINSEDTTPLYDQYDNIRPVTMKKLPLLGAVACGEPIFDDSVNCFVDVSDNIKADFCLVCRGDSMINARIYDGDVVMIQETPMVENGQIAAVSIDNEVTLKRVYYYPESNKLVLNAENPKYEPFVYLNDELESIKILGRAVAFTSLVK